MDDARYMERLDVGFLELLLRADDSTSMLRSFIGGCGRELIVHAPERIEWMGETLMLDLASPEPEFREFCVGRIRQIAEVAQEGGIPVVIHPGGVHPTRRSGHRLLSLLTESLSRIPGRIWIENMPLRYHYGEELLHCNLLVDPDDFTDVLPLVDGVTLDTSHAYLSGGGNRAIGRFIDELGPAIRHLHLSDARHPHDEGMQLGEGDIDFSFIDLLSHLPILLEIRGGHENGGEGFREAIRRVREEGFLDAHLNAKDDPHHVPGPGR